MNTKAILRTPAILTITFLLLLGSIGLVMSVSADEAGEEGTEPIHPDFPSLKVTEEKIETVLGGGNFIGLHNSDNDAMIGLLYGTDENPNNVYIVSIYTRYLGTADVYDDDGNMIAKDHPIPVRTLYAQKFDKIYEFDDVNDDGIWDSRRVSIDPNTDDDNDTSFEVNIHEPVYKKVNLRTSWERSEVTTEELDNRTVEWTVSLTASNLSYRGPLFGFKVDRSNVLEEVTLTFHLWVTPKDAVKEGVPVYEVTVSGKNEANYQVEESKYLENRTYAGKSIDASAKFDHYIEGWDFNTRNDNPCLLMSTEILFANGMSPVATQWVRNQFANRLGGNGSVGYETDEGEEVLDEADATRADGEDDVIDDDVEKPKLIKKNRLHFNDNWQKVGRMTWVSDVEVDGEEDEMHFQVFHARRFSGLTGKGAGYSGFAVIGGFAYPGGDKIFHDPAYSTEAFAIVGDENPTQVLAIPGIAVIGAVVASVAVIVCVGVVTGRSIRKK